jgi:type III pantothenate kinase
MEAYPLTRGIVSSVKNRRYPEWDRWLHERLEYVIMPTDRPLYPIEIRYTTPETLGQDRIAAVVGAAHRCPGQNLLIIDAGTAITYEVVESGGVYVGGNISPGLTTRFRSLHEFTSKLPLLEVDSENEKEEKEIPLIGTSTETAIRAGVVRGLVYEIDGYIESIRSLYADVFVFLTGGHSKYLVDRLKNVTFASENLVLDGLNIILEYNAQRSK